MLHMLHMLYCYIVVCYNTVKYSFFYESVKYSFFSPHVTRAFQFFMTNVFQDILLEFLFYFRCMRGFPCSFQFYLELFSYIFTCFRGVSLIFYDLLCLFRCVRETRLLCKRVHTLSSLKKSVNAYFLAKFRFDTAENEPAKHLKNFRKMHFSKNAFSKNAFSKKCIF